MLTFSLSSPLPSSSHRLVSTHVHASKRARQARSRHGTQMKLYVLTRVCRPCGGERTRERAIDARLIQTESIHARGLRDNENCRARCEAYGGGEVRHIDRERNTYRYRERDTEGTTRYGIHIHKQVDETVLCFPYLPGRSMSCACLLRACSV